MNKLYLVFIMLLLSAFMVGCSSLVKFESEQKTTEQIKKSVVRIRAENQMSNEKWEGTGFVVGVSNDKAYIVTVSHVVEGDPNPTVEFFENNEFKAEVLDNESQENGLALLSVEGQIPYDVMPLYLAKKRDLKSEDKLFTVGFPRGGAHWSYDKLSYSGQKKRNILFSGNINEGNSGSPVIKEDKAVAIITSVNNHVFSTSAVSIREFLEGATGGNKILNEMEKWDIATWHKEYEVRLKNITPIINKRAMYIEDNRILNGTVLAFATKPGGVAADGYGVNSLYTKYLLKAMQIPNLRIEDALKQVYHEVKNASGGKQIPWYNSAYSGSFCFSNCLEHSLFQSPINKSALIIGNANYQISQLKNPANDANNIAQVLKKRGFDVTLKVNLDHRGMGQTISKFIKHLSTKKGVGLFYFSGHGALLEGKHYLLPTDGGGIDIEMGVSQYKGIYRVEEVEEKDILPHKLTFFENIVEKMQEANNGLNVLILDTCRNLLNNSRRVR